MYSHGQILSVTLPFSCSQLPYGVPNKVTSHDLLVQSARFLHLCHSAFNLCFHRFSAQHTAL